MNKEERSSVDVATVYQTKEQSHDIALTARESSAYQTRDLKIYNCAKNSMAYISLQPDSNMSNFKFECNVIRLQLLIREQIAKTNLALLREKINDFKLSFDICEYMRLIGYSNDEIADSTTKANVTRNVSNALTVLQQMTFKIRRGRNNYFQYGIVSAVLKVGDTFTVKISAEFLQLIIAASQYSKKGTICFSKGLFSQFSRDIYTLKRSDEMIILFSLEVHYTMITNKRRKVHDRISIGSLAKILCLPANREEVRKRNTTNYYRYMVRPVVKVLNELSKKGIIRYELYEAEENITSNNTRIKELRHNPELFLTVVVHYKCLSLDNAIDI